MLAFARTRNRRNSHVSVEVHVNVTDPETCFDFETSEPSEPSDNKEMYGLPDCMPLRVPYRPGGLPTHQAYLTPHFVGVPEEGSYCCMVQYLDKMGDCIGCAFGQVRPEVWASYAHI